MFCSQFSNSRIIGKASLIRFSLRSSAVSPVSSASEFTNIMYRLCGQNPVLLQGIHASSSDVCLAADQGDSFNLLKLPYRIFLSLCDGRFSGYMLLPKRVPNGNFLPSRFQWNHSLACFCVSCHFWIKIDNFY